MGCYPLFVCQDWSQLYADLQGIWNGPISLALVADPLGEYDPAYLHKCFDLVIPFKEHFIVDLRHPMNDIVSTNHRYFAQKAFRLGVYVEICQDPTQFAEDWIALYTALIKRHNIQGIKAFSRTALVSQLSVPGLVMLRAVHQGVTVGMLLMFVGGEVVHLHLGAYSDAGYKLQASYALYWSAIEHFANRLRWLEMGGGAGLKSDGTDGLSHFKRGWSTETRQSYFCGRIFDQTTYSEIVRAKAIPTTSYFPAYRKGEFE
jgi:hypothetical protein